MSLIRRVLAASIPRFRIHRRLGPGPLALLVLVGCLARAHGAGAAVDNVRVEPVHFSPNADGIQDQLFVHWSTDAAPESIQVFIVRTVGPRDTVWVFALGPRPAGPDQVVWDGRDSTGAVALEGSYLATISQLTAQGAAVDASGNIASFFLDTTPPPPPFFADAWTDLDTTVAQLQLDGTAAQADSARIYFGGEPYDTVRVVAADSSFAVSVTLQEGQNWFAVQSLDLAGNSSLLTPAITLTYRNTADITVFTARPFRSSPNGDTFLDSVTVQLRLDAPTTRLLVQVRPAKPALVGTVVDSASWIRTLHDAPADPGDYVFSWDGKDSTGTTVADGAWYVSAQAESSGVGGEPLVASRLALVRIVTDTTLPPVPVVSPPPPATTTRNFVVLTGHLPAGGEASDSVYVWRGGSVVGRASGLDWSARVTLLLGANVLALQAIDLAGNHSALGTPFTVVYAEPLGFHAPERFRASDVFDVNLSRTARSVRIDLYELDGRRVRTLLANQFGQRYEVPWNLLDDRGTTVGDGPYVARVTVTYDDGVVETKSGAIVVAK
jgi:flagellar hook assembly protein FlgD